MESQKIILVFNDSKNFATIDQGFHLDVGENTH